MKELLKFISNDDSWIIEQKPGEIISIYRNLQYPAMNRIDFMKNDIGTLVGLLNKFEDRLNGQQK